MKKLILILAIALFVGLMIVAQKSGPLDSLYSFRTSVNEPVIKIFTPLFEDKGLYEIFLAEQRLKETELLAAQGKLGSNEQLTLERLFESAQSRAFARIQRARGNDGLATAHFLATQYRAMLSAHRHILLVCGTQKPDSVQSLERFQYSIEQGLSSVGSEIAGLEQLMTNNMEKQEFVKGFDTKYSRLTVITTDASAWINGRKQALEQSKPQVAVQRLGVVDAYMGEAKKKADADLFGTAFILADTAAGEAREIQSIGQANVDLGIIVSFPEGVLK